MRSFFASILLFCYALTCIGATVNMHRCHGNTMLTLQESAEGLHDSCPLCQKHEAQTPHACDTDAGSESCCQDVRIDLTKDRDEVENVQASTGLPVLSPAVIALAWILAIHPGRERNVCVFPPDGISERSPSAPAYLVLCNFRI